MNKATKILAAIAALALLVGVALTALVRFYLTEERIKSLIIPPAEEALGRQVALGTINVGLFKGITVVDFAVKEQNGGADFIRADLFVLRYELLPLLRKQLVVKEIRLDKPTVRIHRSETGAFNFETLRFLDRPSETRKKQETRGQEAALPVALTVKQIRINQARIEITDATRQLPAVDTTLNATISVDLSQGLSRPHYDGEADFRITVDHGKLKPRLDGTAQFNPQILDLKADLSLESEKIHLEGAIRNLAADPRATLNINGKSLNIDRLLGLLAEMPPASAPEPKQGRAPRSTAPPDRGVPPGLVVKGTIRIDQVLYDKLVLDDFLVQYALEKEIFTLDSLSAGVAGGKILSSATADLNQPAAPFTGKLDIRSLQVKEVLAATYPGMADMLGGTLESSFLFSGVGPDWPRLQKTLTVDGDYRLKKAQIGNTEINRTIAALVGLQEINDLKMESASGNLHVADGKISLTLRMDGQNIKIISRGGTIGFDGALNMPVTLRLSSGLSEKLRQRASLARYLADEKGETVLRLQVTGTVQKPRPALDPAGARDQAERAIRKKLLEQLDQETSGNNDGQKQPAQQLLKGILGL